MDSMKKGLKNRRKEVLLSAAPHYWQSLSRSLYSMQPGNSLSLFQSSSSFMTVFLHLQIIQAEVKLINISITGNR